MALVVILLGAPGAGKGTQAVRLAAARSLPHVSTGDLLRDHRARGTPLGKQAQVYMDKGELVPDALVLDMLAQRVAAPDCREGYVLDGFPRTEVQARSLDQRFDKSDEVRVVNLEVSEETVVARAAGRVSCENKGCGRVYHTQSAPPREPGICDACGGKLVQRVDDAAPVVRERMRVYHQKTAPLVEHYRKAGRLTTIDGEAAPDAVFARLCALIPEKVRR
jgi:adenylate kinase